MSDEVGHERRSWSEHFDGPSHDELTCLGRRL
jgi:hypothetical protein